MVMIQVSYRNDRLLFWRQNLLLRLSTNYTMVTRVSLLLDWIDMSAVIQHDSFDIDSQVTTLSDDAFRVNGLVFKSLHSDLL